MRIPFLDLRRQPPVDPAVVRRVLDSGRYIKGPELEAFEAEFARYCGVAHGAGVGNGTDALEIALRAAGIQPGDEVATVANAGMYGTTVIRAIGAIPLYVDIDPTTLLISPEVLEAAAGPLTRAVIVTHLYGRMAPIAAIVEIAQRKGMVVIEDCAQAHGAVREGKPAGSWGLAGCFSFYPTKNLGACGDAGAIVSSDDAFAERVRALREYGWMQRFHSAIPGGRNSRMDEIQAAILRSKLPLLDQWNERRRMIARQYSEGLAACVDCRPLPAAGDDYVAHLYVIRCRQRDRLRAWLAERGVGAEIQYPVPDHRQQSQANLAARGTPLPHTEQAAEEILSLPCFPSLNDDEIQYVIRCVVEWKP